jgi:hypothetical protein
MAAMAANVGCCGMGRKEPGRAGRRLFAALVGQLAEASPPESGGARRASSGRATSRLSAGRPAAAWALLGARVSLDPEVLRHDTVAFTAGTRTELVKLPTRELFVRAPRHPYPQQSASAGVPRQSGSGNRASVVEPAGRIRRVRPDPAGLAGAAAGVQGPPHRAGRALGGRAAARAGLAKRPGDKTTWGRFPAAEPLFHQAGGCRRMTWEYRWRRVDTGHRRRAGGAGSSRAGAA